MKTGWWRKAGWCAALVALASVASAAPASAQADGRDCRCVDGDGNAIENCTCFVMPEIPHLDGLVALRGKGPFGWTMSNARPRLGVTVSSDQGADVDARGARVADVMQDGPAQEAGIREGDIITSVGGRSLFEPLAGDAEESFDLDESIPVQRLLAITRGLEPGESVEVGYLRDEQAGTATVEVQDLAGQWRAWGERVPIVVRPGTGRFGLTLIELTPGLGAYFGASAGVLVSEVSEDSSLGLRPGDVILRVGDRDATSPERVQRLLATYYSSESVTFRVRRQGTEIDVLGRLGD